jgi:hypothetical protein
MFKMYETVLLPFIYGRKTWSEDNLNLVMKLVFENERQKEAGGWINCIMRSFMICTLHQTELGRANKGRLDKQNIACIGKTK